MNNAQRTTSQRRSGAACTGGRMNTMTDQEEQAYGSMAVPQRAAFLLGKGVTAMLLIDPGEMKPGWRAHAAGCQLPSGWHQSEADAVRAGVAWLESKAEVIAEQAGGV